MKMIFPGIVSDEYNLITSNG